MTVFADLESFLRMPRITGLTLDVEGTRLIATVSTADDRLAKYTDALWEIDPAGIHEPVRLTFSKEGESQPAFTADGSLLFTSSRPDPWATDPGPDRALWRLPAAGEACVVVRTPGGIGAPRVARDAGTVIVTGSRLTGSADEDDDRVRRAARKEQGVTAILHDGMPIRFWDHELGDTEARVFVLEDRVRSGAEVRPTSGAEDRPESGAEDRAESAAEVRPTLSAEDRPESGPAGPPASCAHLRDLAPDAGQRLRNTDVELSPDGTFLLAVFRERLRGGVSHARLVRIAVADGSRSVLLDEEGVDVAQPRIAPDGRSYAVTRRVRGTYSTPHSEDLEIRAMPAEPGAGTGPDHDTQGPADPTQGPQGTGAGGPAGAADAVRADLGDLTCGEYVWSPDGATLYVAGDLDGAGAVLAIDPATGMTTRTLTSDAVYSDLHPSPNGRDLFALRTAIDRPATPVRLDVRVEDQVPVFLPAPGAVGSLPGTVRRVAAEVDGVHVPGWLCLPDGAGEGAEVPVMTWIHGGPFSSWNAWSWRWCPWLAVERGYAVLMPDPALSTGYGEAAIARAWPHRAAVVWQEIEGLLDAVLSDPSLGLDGSRSALLGASFGGYMTNWIAGHTDRFDCIVTHAGLWALDQQHVTTDNAEGKTGIFGTEAEHPDWYAQNSPDRTREAISTPMLLVHGNRDYRVPISEALRAWWDLVAGFDGAPEDMPHRFLQLTGENHWVLTPSNQRVWNETVFAFVDEHVRGARAE